MKLQIEDLTAAAAKASQGMTFPAYRHLLSLEPATRHPEQGDTRLIQPVGVVAQDDGAPIGMALAEAPIDQPEAAAELLSIFVRPESRNQGVATALLERLEEALRARGCHELQAVYMTGKSAIDALERVLDKAGWGKPEARTVTLRFTPEQATRTPWFRRIRLSSEYEIFPWSELKPEELEELKRSQERSPWIVPELEPWRHDRHGYDPVSSLGLRHGGRVVGWVVNHRVSPDTVRFTCSFMRKDLGRRGRIMPLYSASLKRLREAGIETCLFVTPVCYETMVSFVKKRCAPWASFLGETRGVSKRLGGPEPSRDK